VSAGWRSALSDWLRAHQNYPDAARRRGEEGVAVIRFVVGREGRVRDVELLRSSGSPALDAAAQDMLRGASLPPFPADMTQTETLVTLPVRYRLER
jgi:protein TonB